MPGLSLIIFFMLVKGDISSNAQGLFFEAMWVAGPVPIDLPNRII